jgi:hypothetical protein
MDDFISAFTPLSLVDSLNSIVCDNFAAPML